MPLLAAVLLAAQAVAPTPDPCLRMAFGAYCVGGPAASLPKASETSKDGARIAWKDEAGTTYADVFEGKVLDVERRYEPQSWLKWDELMRDLGEALGPGEDRSKFPGYANDRDSQATSIRLGRGRAAHRWAPTDGLVVMMVWDQDSLFVSYVAMEIAKAQRAKASPKF